MFLSQQFASFLQMERQNVRGYVGIAVMVYSGEECREAWMNGCCSGRISE